MGLMRNAIERVFTTLDKLIKYQTRYEEEGSENFIRIKRYWTKKWKRHFEKHGNAPFIVRRLTADRDRRDDVKHGVWKESKERVDFNDGWE
jgi:hypothetical protein